MPVGIFLSGGYDSSLLTVILKHPNEKLKPLLLVSMNQASMNQRTLD